MSLTLLTIMSTMFKLISQIIRRKNIDVLTERCLWFVKIPTIVSLWFNNSTHDFNQSQKIAWAESEVFLKSSYKCFEFFHLNSQESLYFFIIWHVKYSKHGMSFVPKILVSVHNVKTFHQKTVVKLHESRTLEIYNYVADIDHFRGFLLPSEWWIILLLVCSTPDEAFLTKCQWGRGTRN